MAKCPHCYEEINTLDHGMYACLLFTSKLVMGKLDLSNERSALPHTLDSLSEWFSCPECGGSIVDETQTKDKLGLGIYQVAERFLNGVENYLEEDKPK
jgi:hypothetical protein